MLQLFGPESVQAEPFQFVNSELTKTLCERAHLIPDDEDLRAINDWTDSIAEGLGTGEVHSRGFTIGKLEHYNEIGQKYYSPVVVIYDGLSYSTTDIFG